MQLQVPIRLTYPVTLVLAIAILVPGQSILAQTSSSRQFDLPLKFRLQARLKNFHANGEFPGATLGVVLRDGQSLALAVGVSDRERKTPMKPNDLMLAGSVGKTFFAAVALQLIKESKIGLDDPLSKYVGEEKWFSGLPNSGQITIRMLMNHTSGIVRYEFNPQFMKDVVANPYKVWTPEEQFSYLLGTEAQFEAGEGWTYSDTNYILLALIIEKVTGAKAYDEIKERVLDPLGLRRTVPSDNPFISGLVQGYAGPDNPFGSSDAMIADGKLVFNPQFEWGGGGFASNAEDLARWARFIYEGKAFDPSLLPQVLDGVSARLGPGTQYGLCVIITPTRHGPAYGHSGFFPGYLSEMRYYAKHKFAVALQVNTSESRKVGRRLGSFLDDLADDILGNNK